MAQFRLYGTLGCHLCELAEAMLQRQQLRSEFALEIVEIADSDELMEIYGVRIPVLRCTATNNELGWPFTDEELADWLDSSR